MEDNQNDAVHKKHSANPKQWFYSENRETVDMKKRWKEREKEEMKRAQKFFHRMVNILLFVLSGEMIGIL